MIYVIGILLGALAGFACHCRELRKDAKQKLVICKQDKRTIAEWYCVAIKKIVRQEKEIQKLKRTVAKLRSEELVPICGIITESVAFAHTAYLIEKWRKDVDMGNWGKYLAREREIREGVTK